MGKTIEIPLRFHNEITAEQVKMNELTFGHTTKAGVIRFWFKMWEEYKATLKADEIKEKMRLF